MKAIKQNYVGIDVGSKELVVKVQKNGQLLDGVATFTNDKAGHKKLLKYITKHKSRAQVCMEATGVYHFQLALLLFNTPDLDVMVVNPKAIKHFAIASMKRAKTDAVDAHTILMYLQRMDFIAWQAPNDECLALQALSRRLHQLKNEMTREHSRRHAGDYKDVVAGAINNDIEVNIRHLTKRVTLLETKALQIIQASEQLNKKYQLLLSVKGIAMTAAIQLLSELVCLPSDMRPAQWVAYAGLDPRAVESGSSVNKQRRISKAGNKYLRTALYMPALVAIQSEPEVARFYNHLVDSGKLKMRAVVAVMRKLLHAIWGILHSETPWDPDKFYRVKKV